MENKSPGRIQEFKISLGSEDQHPFDLFNHVVCAEPRDHPSVARETGLA